ncbi:DNA mismatch repair endonuclease MutL [Dethiobacter alkaliphilus]|uniref:DNA mismatch repair protein MutL n=1 Tax=Dethiobacter alkaliphilus AHT 1 TaxID=555088 RepID=C0GDR1_DETAL|nr:DNA mismatch repair endonuclease MutL [Dethiobacter alkaliphilus]EEG78544.1 DNA mismatch repair protein MutL [Dethiobacter alkaliphilus AHT 1]
MGRILLLDEVTANKIAAGEVVERPAAVIKELVENALDAGATRIDISIAGGGLESMRVADNGAGMAAEDVPLALQRHATSKIQCAEDLTRVTSMGFRGEALPSIAAVSRFRLVSRRAEDMAGTEIEVEGGKTLQVTETGCPVGTEVRVEDLFFNTPARLKFTKSQGAETARITDTVQRLALAWPNVSFSLTVNGKNTLVTPGNGQLADAAGQVLGRQNMRQMIPLDWQGELLALHGFLAKPALSRANRNLQFFFVNKRPIRSPLLSDALQTAYQTLLPRNRFPAAIVFVEMDTSEVDVNVHPAKREVRFSRERDIYRQLLAGAKAALRQASLIGEMGTPHTAALRETAAATGFYDQAIDFDRQKKLPQDNVPLESPFAGKREAEAVPAEIKETNETAEPAAAETNREATEDVRETTHNFPRLRPIGQYRDTYILAQSQTGELYVVDQHAAHERVLYDQLKRELSDGTLPVQDVIPQTFELDPLTAAALLKSLNIFAELGLRFETFGNNIFILRSIPMFFRHCLNQDDLTEILNSAADADNTHLFEKTLQMMSCKGAVKANQSLDPKEMSALLNNLAETSQPHTCPHGRPTVLVLTEQAVARNFRRQ